MTTAIKMFESVKKHSRINRYRSMWYNNIIVRKNKKDQVVLSCYNAIGEVNAYNLLKQDVS